MMRLICQYLFLSDLLWCLGKAVLHVCDVCLVSSLLLFHNNTLQSSRTLIILIRDIFMQAVIVSVATCLYHAREYTDLSKG